MSGSRLADITRREALELLGITVVAGALPRRAFAQAPTFPKGAVIRTILKDYAPEELAGGATLFHEHMSLAPDFMTRFGAATAATRAANGPPAGARAGGAGGGGSAAAGGRGWRRTRGRSAAVRPGSHAGRGLDDRGARGRQARRRRLHRRRRTPGH